MERKLLDRLVALSSGAGTHSPSLVSLQRALPEFKVDVDACFLSNPLATELFWSHFNSDSLADPRLFSRMLEAYPSQNRVIAEGFSEVVGVEPECIFVANGATEAIQAIIHNYSSHVHVNIPTFSPYYEFATPHCRVTTFQVNASENFTLDPEKYVRSVLDSGADTAVLISPNNPDGYMVPHDHLSWILSKLGGLRTVIVDESFFHFAERNSSEILPSLIDVTGQFDNVTVVKSMSKDFGVAGIRAGYALMNPKRVSELLNRGYLWNLNGIAEYFFSLFNRQTFLLEYKRVLDSYRAIIDKFVSMTSRTDVIRTFPTAANFQLMKIRDGISADMVTILMLIRHGIYVRSCSDKLGLDGEFLRVAIRTDSENERVLTALEDVLVQS